MRCVTGCTHAGPPRRRHLRAVPLPLRAARRTSTADGAGGRRPPAACVGSVLQLLEEGATHLGVATDHVIESFRNDLWPGYKTGEGMRPELLGQFPLLEEALGGAGRRRCGRWSSTRPTTPWRRGRAWPRPTTAVEQVRHLHARQGPRRSASVGNRSCSSTGARTSCSTPTACARSSACRPSRSPTSSALVGDSADGFPGLPGWGAKSAAAVLARYGHLEAIPADGDRLGHRRARYRPARRSRPCARGRP